MNAHPLTLQKARPGLSRHLHDLIGTPKGGMIGKTLIIPAEPDLLDEQTESSFVLHHP